MAKPDWQRRCARLFHQCRALHRHADGPTEAPRQVLSRCGDRKYMGSRQVLDRHSSLSKRACQATEATTAARGCIRRRTAASTVRGGLGIYLVPIRIGRVGKEEKIVHSLLADRAEPIVPCLVGRVLCSRPAATFNALSPLRV